MVYPPGVMVLLPLVFATSTLAVPFVSQHKDTCGAASLTMVLRYWKEEVSQDDVARALVRPSCTASPAPTSPSSLGAEASRP